MMPAADFIHVEVEHLHKMLDGTLEHWASEGPGTWVELQASVARGRQRREAYFLFVDRRC